MLTEENLPQKPLCPLIGADGNIFNLLGLAATTLRESGMREQAREMRARATAADSYEAALCVIMDYVEPFGTDDFDEEEDCEPEFNGMGGYA